MMLTRRAGLLLCGSGLIALLPHILRQPPWLATLLFLLIAGRAWRFHTGRGRLSAGLLVPAALLIAGGIFAHYRSLIGSQAGIALLAGLIILKLFEGQSRRDARLLLGLAIFATSTHFLVSQAPWMAAYTLASLFFALLTWLEIEQALLRLHEQARLAARLILEALPIAVLLFLFFPRMDGPLWSMPAERAAKSGLSGDALDPGSISQLALDDSVAFRVSFTGRLPDRSRLYWRGPVYDFFDGRRWLPFGGRERRPPTEITPQGPRVDYQITLEPHQQNWLLALDLPTRWPAEARLNSRFQLLSGTAVNQRLRYGVQSTLAWQTAPETGLRAHLQLPAGNPQAQVLAATWRQLKPEARVAAALDFFRNNAFGYTLEPPELLSRNSIDEFLFTHKLGFCEHYASAFAWLMRAAQVPARVVGGYQGGDYNAAGQYLIVRQADAHAWTEVWLEGRGWQRVDPTAVVAPARIADSLARSVPRQAGELPMMLRDGVNWLKQTRLRWDVVVNSWNQWVIGYNVQRQLDVLNRLGIEQYLSLAYLGWLGGLLALVLSAIALYMLWPGMQRKDKAQRAYLRFCRKLSRHGLTIRPSEAPLSLARRATRQWPGQAEQIESIIMLYLATRYGEHHSRLRQLEQAVRRLRIS